jgi:phosphate transport system substrate-binding protein
MAKIAVILSLLIAGVAAAAAPLRVNGSTTVNAVASEAAEALRAERKMNIQVDTQGGSSGGIAGVGDGSIDVGMLSKPVSDDDRKKYPKVNFVVTEIGRDAVALVVSADVYNGGVHALSKQQARDIFEGKITNWKSVGGPDRRIAFFNKEPGRGPWEQFAHWIYGDPKKAPRVSHPEVGGNEETRNKVGATKGAISQLSASWATGNVKALAIRLDDGTVVQPIAAEVVSGRYPMSRPLTFVTNGPPRGDAKTFIDFVLTPRGQDLVRKHGYLRLADLKVRKDAAVASKKK